MLFLFILYGINLYLYCLKKQRSTIDRLRLNRDHLNKTKQIKERFGVLTEKK